MMKYIPNTLTVIRFLLIPLIVTFCVNGNYLGAVIVFTISGITDIVDGFVARRFNVISNFGKLMDPLADKTTQIAILAVLVSQQMIPLWILLIVVLKELSIISRCLFLVWQGIGGF